MTRALALALTLAAGSVVEAQPDEYARAVTVALKELAGGQIAAGRDRLAGLVAQNPERVPAHCHLAEAHRMVGDLEPAITSYRECARLARQSSHPEHEARGLLGTAQTLARIHGRLGEAKEAYAAMLTFAEAHPEVVPPALVRARAAAVDAILAADVAAAAVRTRREARAGELAAQASDSPESSD